MLAAAAAATTVAAAAQASAINVIPGPRYAAPALQSLPGLRPVVTLPIPLTPSGHQRAPDQGSS